MTCEECEALGVFFKEHLAEIAVAETYLAAVGNGAGDAECLKAFADCGGGFGCLTAALLDSDSGAYGVSPLCVFKADGLNVFNCVINIKAGVFCDFFGFFY